MKTLIIAFDGLDHDLIEKYGCENIQQNEFGSINNTEDVEKIHTGELFASFITGQPSDIHGISGIKHYGEGWKGRIAELLEPPGYWRANIRGCNFFNRVKDAVLGVQKHSYTKEYIQCETIFEKVENSEALNVPSYSKNTFLDRQWMAIQLGFGREVWKRDVEAEHLYRRKELWDALDRGRDLLMAHFHKPDIVQHMNHVGKDPRGGGSGELDEFTEGEIEEMYHEMDEFGGEILEKASDKFDLILFISDHGLPKGRAHNQKAFYSSNVDMGLENPKLTDFHDILLEKTSHEESDIGGIEI